MCLLFADPGQPLRLGRAAVLHDDGLDDVELDGLRPRPRDHPRPLRRVAPAAASGKSTLKLSGLVCYILYKVTMVVAHLGWVDLDLGCSTLLLGSR